MKRLWDHYWLRLTISPSERRSIKKGILNLRKIIFTENKRKEKSAGFLTFKSLMAFEGYSSYAALAPPFQPLCKTPTMVITMSDGSAIIFYHFQVFFVSLFIIVITNCSYQNTHIFVDVFHCYYIIRQRYRVIKFSFNGFISCDSGSWRKPENNKMFTCW